MGWQDLRQRWHVIDLAARPCCCRHQYADLHGKGRFTHEDSHINCCCDGLAFGRNYRNPISHGPHDWLGSLRRSDEWRPRFVLPDAFGTFKLTQGEASAFEMHLGTRLSSGRPGVGRVPFYSEGVFVKFFSILLKAPLVRYPG